MIEKTNSTHNLNNINPTIEANTVEEKKEHNYNHVILGSQKFI